MKQKNLESKGKKKEMISMSETKCELLLPMFDAGLST